jgi:Tfp pilus assembly protein FimV
VTTAPPSTPISAPTPTDNPAEPGDRTHTVRPGESLWSIADDALGSAATPAQIAREVHRLWELNKDRIATGDPDLLMIDTRLKLR